MPELSYPLKDSGCHIPETPEALSPDNSSKTPLGISASFTGGGILTAGLIAFTVVVETDEDGTLKLQSSADDIVWNTDRTVVLDATNNRKVIENIDTADTYFRALYENGGTAQTILRLQCVCHRDVSVQDIILQRIIEGEFKSLKINGSLGVGLVPNAANGIVSWSLNGGVNAGHLSAITGSKAFLGMWSSFGVLGDGGAYHFLMDAANGDTFVNAHTGRTGYLRINNSTQASWNNAGFAVNALKRLGLDGIGGDDYIVTSGTGVIHVVNGNVVISIDSSQKVGIGTLVPDKVLHIAKDATNAGLLLLENSRDNSGGSIDETAALNFGFGGINIAGQIRAYKIEDFTSGANETAGIEVLARLNGNTIPIIKFAPDTGVTIQGILNLVAGGDLTVGNIVAAHYGYTVASTKGVYYDAAGLDRVTLDPTLRQLRLEALTGAWVIRAGVADRDLHFEQSSSANVNFKIENTGNGIASLILEGGIAIGGDFNHTGTKYGAYNTTPIVKQTGVAVTTAAIHAALVNLGFIAA